MKRILAFWAPDTPVFAYGSRVHGRGLKPNSPLELCFKASKAVPARVFWQVRDALDLSDLAVRVELADWHDLSPAFRARIIDELVSLDQVALENVSGAA